MNKDKLKNIIPILLLLFFSLKQIIVNYSTINQYHIYSKLNHTLTFGIVFLLVFFIIFFCQYKIKQYAAITFIGIMIVVSSFITKDLAIVVFYLFVLALKNIDYKKIVKTICFSQITGVSLILMLFNLGLIDERISTRLGIVRRSYGFGHPAFLSTFYLMIVMELFYLYENKIKYYHIIIVVILAEIIDRTTDGRTNMYCLFLFLFLFVIRKSFRKILDLKTIMYVTNYIFLFLALLCSVYLAAKFNPYNILEAKLNSILSNRLYLSNYFWNNYGPSLFGQPLKFISTLEGSLTGQSVLILDNFYLNLVIKFGLVMTGLFVGFVLKLLKLLYLREETTLLIIVFVFLVYSLISPIIINLELNFIFFAGVFIFQKQYNPKNEQFN